MSATFPATPAPYYGSGGGGGTTRRMTARQRANLFNPDRGGRLSWALLVLAFGVIIAAIAVFTFFWVTWDQQNRAMERQADAMRAEYEALAAFVGNFSTECNCTGVNFTFPVTFPDDEFTLFNAVDPSKTVQFNVSGLIGPLTTVLLTIQDGVGGTVAYLSDIPVYPDTFLDDAFAVVSAGDNTRQVMLDCSGIAAATIRTLTSQDGSGTVAYLADIPAISSVFEDDVFVIFNAASPTKEVQLDCSGISTLTTQFMTIQNVSGVIAYLSDLEFLNATFPDDEFTVFSAGDPTREMMLDVTTLVSPASVSVMTVQDADGTIAYLDQAMAFTDVTIDASRTFPNLANENAATLTALGVTQLQIWMCGGGGGGGGSNIADGGGGGGSGSAVEAFFVASAADRFSTLTVTIGAGGSGGAGATGGGTAGTVGGTTTVVGVPVTTGGAFLSLAGYGGGAGGTTTVTNGGAGAGSGASASGTTPGTAGTEGGLAGGAVGVSGGFRYPWHAGGGGGDEGLDGAAWYGGGQGGAGGQGGGGGGSLFAAGGDGGAALNSDGTAGGRCAGGGGAGTTNSAVTGGAGGAGRVFVRYWTQ